MALRINDTAPDFTADTTQGEVSFHDWVGDGWAMLFSHPKDFTPVCATELAYVAKISDEFAKLNCKVIGLSVDKVEDHERWASDIEDLAGTSLDYPLIADNELAIAKLYDMLPAEAGDSAEGRTAADNQTVRSVFLVGPDKKSQDDADLSDEFRAELRRVAARTEVVPADGEVEGGDARQLAGGRGRHHRPRSRQ